MLRERAAPIYREVHHGRPPQRCVRAGCVISSASITRKVIMGDGTTSSWATARHSSMRLRPAPAWVAHRASMVSHEPSTTILTLAALKVDLITGMPLRTVY